MAKRGLTKKKVLNFLWGYPGNEFLRSVIGYKSPIWTNIVPAIGITKCVREYCLHLGTHWAPLKTPKCLLIV